MPKTTLTIGVALLVLLAAGSATADEWWPATYQLTNDRASDIHPSAGRDWLETSRTILVWQTNRNGTWDIYSRLDTSVNTWTAEVPVTRAQANDINPVTDGYSCCIWEREESDQRSSIWAALLTPQDSWIDTVQIGISRHAAGRAAQPSVIELVEDGVSWAVWPDDDSLGHAIYYSYSYTGGGNYWTVPAVAVRDTAELHHARIGRGGTSGVYHPLLVWEKSGDIYYSECIDQVWTTPSEVAHSPAMDLNPEVMGESYGPPGGPWVLWQSTRDGDTAIFITASDSFQVAHRVCNSRPAGVNVAPVGVPAAWLATDFEARMTVWVTDRRGNPDICYSYANDGSDALVDSNPALDSSPSVTMLGPALLWCFWQSNRSGNWDIYGSYVYISSGVQVNPTRPGSRLAPITSVVRNAMYVPQSLFGQHHSHVVLLDAVGRRVLDLKPGPNDVSKLATGVYFISERSTVGGQQSAVKIVIQR